MTSRASLNRKHGSTESSESKREGGTRPKIGGNLLLNDTPPPPLCQQLKCTQSPQHSMHFCFLNASGIKMQQVLALG